MLRRRLEVLTALVSAALGNVLRKQYPEYSSPDVARLILDYNEECVKKIIDYCDKNNIKYDRNILGAVFAKLTEEQIVQISSGGLIEVVVNEPAFRGASSH